MKHGVKVDSHSSDDLQRQYPKFQNMKNMKGLLECEAGFVRPELAIEEALKDVKATNGAMRRDNINVEGIQEIVDGNQKYVEIETVESDGFST